MTEIYKKEHDWQPSIKLERYFTPTDLSKSKERGKARYKNSNLPVLQYMYNGDETKPLVCLISGAAGWVDFDCLHTNKPKQRFNIDFNHIRQYQDGGRRSGYSKDKGDRSPSEIFRDTDLRYSNYALTEFMTIMPISQEYHSYVSQDSARDHLTLANFNTKWWPWFLQSKANYDTFTSKFFYGMVCQDYDWFVDHLSDINHKPIQLREFYTHKKPSPTIQLTAPTNDVILSTSQVQGIVDDGRNITGSIVQGL